MYKRQEEDGVDNTGIDNSKLYTQPEEVAHAYEALKAIGPDFTIAAAFGNVHGVYKPGNVSPVSYTHLDVYKRQAMCMVFISQVMFHLSLLF